MRLPDPLFLAQEHAAVTRSRSHLRNLALAVLTIALVLAFATTGRTINAQQGGLVTLTPFVNPQTGTPGGTVTFTFTLTNNQAAQDTFVISTSSPTLPSGYQVLIPSSSVVVNGAGGQAQVQIVVTIPNGRPAESFDITVAADAGGGATANAIARLTVNGPTATPTVTPVTPTGTPTPVSTPSGCPEAADPPGDLPGAALLRVDVPERHGICDVGDVDWYKFGAVGGKVYSIDVPEMNAGLDLSLGLYEENGNRLTFNDDYNFRNPNQPDPNDIKPRIDTWRAPYDGFFYIQVRDNLGIGGGDRAYTIVINSESYGPTPAQITEVCQDLFEQDGLPEQAKLITSNETHRGKVLCPVGDADWVKFFALRGKTYFIYTDTRPYGQGGSPGTNPGVQQGTEAGADTVIYLADRDGVSILDFNDDIVGGSTLDSQLQFTPSADGFYYAQVKNVGDIGNQFIRYDFTLALCLPDQAECGRPTASLPAPTSSSGSNQFTATPTPTEFDFLDDTATPTEDTSGSSGNFSQSSLKPGPMVNGPLRGFADPSFDRVWQRSDRPVAEQRASRSWMWGPRGLMARTEGYIQSPSGLRQVQYFDKARMEVNNPRADRNTNWFVTTGLLVVELITGRVQLGDNEFVQRPPADIPIAGDPGDPNAPTYVSFGGVTALQPGDRTGQFAAETIDHAGTVGPYGGPQRPEVRLVHFVPETGHNIPQVFWDYLNASGTVYDSSRYRADTLIDWVFTLGYPLSDPYWTRIKVGGIEREVLVQAFQRRVLTYSPDNPAGWQVEMGNVGRHYYFWRYGDDLPS
jgi:hypothetical protein